MIKKVLLAFAVTLAAINIKAQTEEPRELNCYNKWSQKFDERGADEVEDGIYTDVIITSRIGAKANCWSGKAEVRGKKLVKLYIICLLYTSIIYCHFERSREAKVNKHNYV